MDRVCQQFLAGAGFAKQQHGCLQPRRASRLLLDLLRRRAVADVVERCIWRRRRPDAAASAPAGVAGGADACRKAANGCSLSNSAKPMALMVWPLSSVIGSRVTTKESPVDIENVKAAGAAGLHHFAHHRGGMISSISLADRRLGDR